MAIVAVRNRVIFKMALRNAPRRRSQVTLIILGLMLATLLFSATFTTGDTLAHSIPVQALGEIGEIDLIIKTENRLERPNSFNIGTLNVGKFDQTKSVSLLRFAYVPDSLGYLTADRIDSIDFYLTPNGYALGDTSRRAARLSCRHHSDPILASTTTFANQYPNLAPYIDSHTDRDRSCSSQSNSYRANERDHHGQRQPSHCRRSQANRYG